MKIVEFTNEDMKKIFNDPLKKNKWEMFQSGIPYTEELFKVYKERWDIFGIEHDNEFVGHFGLNHLSDENTVQLSKAIILTPYRNKIINKKPICEYLGEFAVNKAKELYPENKKIWYIAREINENGKLIKNKGRKCWEKIGFRSEKELDVYEYEVNAKKISIYTYIYMYFDING